MNASIEKTVQAIREKLLKAASRNKYNDLKTKKEWDQKSLEELGKECDLFEGCYMSKKTHYVFLKDGSCVELGNKKFNGPSEAMQSFIERVKKAGPEGTKFLSDKNFTFKRISDALEFKHILKNSQDQIRARGKPTKKRESSTGLPVPKRSRKE
jgi:hypothetical protein